MDNGSLEVSRNKLRKFLKEFSLEKNIILVETQTSIAHARNLGAEAASSNVIVFIDDDTLLIDSLGLSKILSKVESFQYGYGAIRHWTKDVKWFLNHQERLKKDFKLGRFDFLLRNIGEPSPEIRRKLSSKYLTRSFIGNFGFIDKAVFKKLGGFPEVFKGYGIEDDAFSFLCYIKYGPPCITL